MGLVISFLRGLTERIAIDNKTKFYDSKNQFKEEIINFTKGYDSKYLIVSSPKESAKKIVDSFNLKSATSDQELKSILHSILINASIALYLNETNSDLDECYQIAEENIYNGKALKKLNQLIEITNK